MQQPKDWSKYQIMEALNNKGYSGVTLSKTFGFHKSAVSKTISGKKRWPAIEQLISDVIGLPKETIFAERYQKPITNLCSYSNKKSPELQVKNGTRNLHGFNQNQKVA